MHYHIGTQHKVINTCDILFDIWCYQYIQAILEYTDILEYGTINMQAYWNAVQLINSHFGVLYN